MFATKVRLAFSIRLMGVLALLSAAWTTPAQATGGCKSCNRACLHTFKGRGHCAAQPIRGWAPTHFTSAPLNACSGCCLSESFYFDHSSNSHSFGSVYHDSGMGIPSHGDGLFHESWVVGNTEETEESEHPSAGQVVNNGTAIRLEVVCPPDTFLTVNGEATKARGARRYLDLPIPSDPKEEWEYTVEGFVTRNGRLMTFLPDTGKLIAYTSTNMKINQKVIKLGKLSNSNVPSLRPLIFRNDDRPRLYRELYEPQAFDGLFSSSPFDEDNQLAAAEPVVIAPPVIGQADTTLKDGFNFIKLDIETPFDGKVPFDQNTDKKPTLDENLRLHLGPDHLLGKKTSQLYLSPIIAAKVKYKSINQHVESFELATAVDQLPVYFRGEPKARTPTLNWQPKSMTLKFFVNPTIVEGQLNPYTRLGSERTVEVQLPTFDSWGQGYLSLKTDTDNATKTFWEVIVDQANKHLFESEHRAEYLVIQISLQFASVTANGKDESHDFQNYLILLINPK